MSGTKSQMTAVRAAVHHFYRLVGTDQQLAPYFVGTDLRRLERYLTNALTAALRTSGWAWPVELVNAHRGLGLTEDDFDLLGHLLLTTLLPLRLGPDLLTRVGAALSDAQAQVVGRHPAGGPAPRPVAGSTRRRP